MCIPCYAIKSMMFNNIDQYISRAEGIWIVKTLQRTGQERSIGPVHQAEVLQTLKGDPQEDVLSICPVFRELVPGHRYLVFGFTRDATNGTWIDNGNVSPVPIPNSFSLTELDGKPLKDKISIVLSARYKELARLIKRYKEEKSVLEKGLQAKQNLDESLKEISIAFKNKARTGARLKEGEILFKHLKIGMSRDKVRHLLGEPDPKHSTSDKWFYTTWYSRFIGVEFQNDKVVKISGG